MKPVLQSAVAQADIRAAAEYYRDQAGHQVAAALIGAVEQVVQQIGMWPGSGSSRFAEMLDLPSVRTVALHQFPYIVFYAELPGHVEVWRVLHNRRDVPRVLGG